MKNKKTVFFMAAIAAMLTISLAACAAEVSPTARLSVKAAGVTAANQEEIVVIGDSYSDIRYYTSEDGTALHGSDVDTSTDMWYQVMAAKNGSHVKTVDAVAGSTLVEGIRERIKAAKPDDSVNAVILLGGLNDIWQEKGTEAYSEALSECLELLKVKYPQAVVRYSLVIPDDAEYGQEAYRTAAEQICSAKNVEFIPIRDIDKISYHPSKQGMRQIAERLSE